MRRELGEVAAPPTARASHPLSRVRSLAGKWGLLMIAAGWAGIVLAHAVADLSADPTAGRALLVTGVVVLISVVTVGVGGVVAVGAARSPMRWVFHRWPTFWTGVLLLSTGAVVVGLLVLREPFDRVAQHGDVTSTVVADLGCMAASFLTLGAAAVSLHESWEALRDERRWTRTPRRRFS